LMKIQKWPSEMQEGGDTEGEREGEAETEADFEAAPGWAWLKPVVSNPLFSTYG